jgi:hypothetical protein
VILAFDTLLVALRSFPFDLKIKDLLSYLSILKSYAHRSGNLSSNSEMDTIVPWAVKFSFKTLSDPSL